MAKKKSKVIEFKYFNIPLLFVAMRILRNFKQNNDLIGKYICKHKKIYKN